MEKIQKKLVIKVIFLIALILIGFFAYKNLHKKTGGESSGIKLPENTKQISFVDETKKPKAVENESQTKTSNVTPLIQSVPYVDTVSKFSINLPTGWSVLGKENSEKTSKVSFSDVSIKNAPNAKIMVERIERDKEMDKKIQEMGADMVLLLLADDLSVSLGLTNTSIKKISINNRDFFYLSGTYVGQTSKKEVTQSAYFALTPDAHYRIGVDAYTDVWIKNKDAILKSIDSLFLQ